MGISEHNTRLTEAVLRKEREGQYLERKGRDAKPSKIANTLISMLNAGGGTLVYGIADDGMVEDLRQHGLFADVPPDLSAYRKVVHDYIEPPANIILEEVELSCGGLVLLYHIEPDYERMYQRRDNEAVYLRVADETKGPLARDEVKKLEYNKSIRSFEDEVCADFDAEELDRGICEKFRSAMRFAGTFEELAWKRNLAARKDGAPRFRNSAVLLFSENPERHIPNAAVRYVRYDGVERRSGKEFNVVKDQRFEGSIPALIRELETFIEASLRDYYYLDINQGRFMRVPEFPKDAWLEGIINALCHRSYNIQGNPVMILHFDDRMEISNSGPLPAQVTVENIASQRFSRNPRIARTLVELGYVRELNEGVPRIYRAMAEFMLAQPEYSDEGSIVTLTLRNKVSDHRETILADVVHDIERLWPNLNNTEQRIINLLIDVQEATIKEMTENLQLSDQAIRNNLKKLEELTIIDRHSEKIRDPRALYRFRSG